MTNILCFTIFLLVGGICSVSADKQHDVIQYIDEVLSVYVPWSVEEAGLELYEMPDLSHNFQNRSSEGASVNIKARYHSGNLTGLDVLHRVGCQEPTWSFSNISFTCSVFLPRIEVQYEGEFQELTGFEAGIRFRQHPFSLSAIIDNVGASLEITSSPHIRVPTIKSISLSNQGNPHISYSSKEDVSYERLSEHFFHSYNKVFEELFYGSYRKALNRAVESVLYP